jgi:hypothetical protein
VQRARGIDYGSENPFVCLWGALLADDLVVVYREVFAKGLSPAEQAQLIRDSETSLEVGPGRPMPAAIDPSTFAANPDHPAPPKQKARSGSSATRRRTARSPGTTSALGCRSAAPTTAASRARPRSPAASSRGRTARSG